MFNIYEDVKLILIRLRTLARISEAKIPDEQKQANRDKKKTLLLYCLYVCTMGFWKNFRITSLRAQSTIFNTEKNNEFGTRDLLL